MKFYKERLIEVRTKLGISKAEAARQLNMSAMGYGRYENGDRTPSFQTISFMAQKLGTSIEYLCGETESMNSVDFIISTDTPELYNIVESLKDEPPDKLDHILKYIKNLQGKNTTL